MNPPRIAFLGLGVMGAGMTRRLLGANFPVAVYNRDPAKSAPLRGRGGPGSPRRRATRPRGPT